MKTKKSREVLSTKYLYAVTVCILDYVCLHRTNFASISDSCLFTDEKKLDAFFNVIRYGIPRTV